jgi:hypothetical protein
MVMRRTASPNPESSRLAVLRGFLLALSFLFALSLGAFADILHLKDGRRIEGQVVEETTKVVRIKTRLGELEFKPSEVESIERGKTKSQEFDERWARAVTGDDFFELGKWAEKKRLRKETRKAMKQAVRIDPKHAGANSWLGLVEYRGDWMTPEERDRRMAADREAEMREKGLVRYGKRWVTPAERDKLEAGLVLHGGEWIPFAEAQRAKGLEEFEGRWITRSEAFARLHAAEASLRAGIPFALHFNEEALIAGPAEPEFLSRVGDGILIGRKWFNEEMHASPGLLLLGDRLAEFYAFAGENKPYIDTVEYFASLTPTLPEGWAPIAARSHGFFWTDPFALSSARRWHRGIAELEGHCYHHWGHMLLNRLEYDGRLLPPWYDEAFASLTEFNIHDRNAVFCRSRTTASTGTVAKKSATPYSLKRVREGGWRKALMEALKAGVVPTIADLSKRDFGDLEVLDIATGMGILEWIDSHDKLALRKFHTVLRRSAPEVPLRIIRNVHERLAVYDAAFEAATGEKWVGAERAWRKWFLSR